MREQIEKSQFRQASPVSPLRMGTWPGDRKDNLYWILRKEFILAQVPERVNLKIAADRHYEIFLNSKRISGQRNYFHGSKYIFAQDWKYKGRECCLKPGINTIEILIRSDVFGSKNYVTFHPFAMLEIFDGESQALAVTDHTWQCAILQDWRIMTHLATSAAYEKINLQNSDGCGVWGTPEKLEFFTPCVLEGKKELPSLYDWTDVPVKLEKYLPKKALYHGGCVTKDNALVFNISDIFKLSAKATLKTVISLPKATTVSLAVSAMCKCEVQLNGRRVAVRNSLPSRALMRQDNYASPICELALNVGENILEFQFDKEHERFFGWQNKYQGTTNVAGLFFKIIIHEINGLFWIAGETYITPVEYPEGIWGKLNAKGKEIFDAEISFKPDLSCLFVSGLHASQKYHVLLDYGQTVRGYFSFCAEAETSGRIFLAYGIMKERDSVDCARNGRRAVDSLVIPAGKSTYISMENRAFVYLDIVFEGFEGDVSITDLNAEEQLFLDNCGIHFRSSNELMTQIWKRAERTAQLCCDEIYMDNPERERGQWIDNATPNMAAGYYWFGEAGKAAKFLEETSLLQRTDGQLPGNTGAWGERVPLQGHMALYIFSVWRHFQYTGDLDFSRRALRTVLKIIDFWMTYQNRDGLLENLETIFIDWGVHIYSYCPESDNPPPVGINTAINAYYLKCLRLTSALANCLGDICEKRLRENADKLENAIRKNLFDKNRGLFRDGMNNPLAEANYSQAANVLAVAAGAASPHLAKSILKNAFVESLPWRDIIPASAQFTMNVGEALFDCGLGEIAYNWLLCGYGPMVNDPAGTLWETWEPYVSHCQGSASSVLYLLARYHAGFYPAEPGFAKIGINPAHCGQKQLETTLKTLLGIVEINWKYEGEIYYYDLKLPEALKHNEIIANEAVRLHLT